MVNFIPEDIRPEELQQKPESDDFEIEIIKPQTQPVKPPIPPASAKPVVPSAKPLVNPWVGGGIEDRSTSNVVDLSQEGLTLDDGLSQKISTDETVVFRNNLFKEKLINIFNKIGQFIVKIIHSKVFLGSEIVPSKKKIPTGITTGAQPEVEISLMPDEAPVTQRMVYEKILILLAVAAFLFLIVFLGWSWVNWRSELARTQINQIKVEMLATEGKINSYNDSLQQIRLLEKQSNRAISLLRDHVYWTKFFNLLETHTVPDVYYSNFVAKAGDKITLPAVARDLTSVARQLAAFYSAPDFVEDATITNLVAGPKSVNFNITLTLNPDVLKK